MEVTSAKSCFVESLLSTSIVLYEKDVQCTIMSSAYSNHHTQGEEINGRSGWRSTRVRRSNRRGFSRHVGLSSCY